MSKKTKKIPFSASSPKGEIEIDPDIVYFTHSRVRPFFTGCNKRIEETFEEISQGKTSIADIPLITVIYNEGCYFSLNNRRLFLWKWLKREGYLAPKNTITATVKLPLEREKIKYLPNRFSLQAKFMKEHVKGDPNAKIEEFEGESTESREEIENDGLVHQDEAIISKASAEREQTVVKNGKFTDRELQSVTSTVECKEPVSLKAIGNKFNLLLDDDEDSDLDG